MIDRKTNLSSLSDEDLMRRLMNESDHEALAHLYQRYATQLLGYFIKIFKGDVQKAQDTLQDVFVRVMEKKHTFNPEKRFYSWVFTIGANMCRMSFREELTETIDGREAEEILFTEMNLYDRKELKNELRSAIYALEYHHRSVFILRYNEGFSLDEIAEITETETGTVKSRLFYATKKLAKKLAQKGVLIENKRL